MNTKKSEFRVTVKTHSGDSYIYTESAHDHTETLLRCQRTLLDDEFFSIPDSSPPVILHPSAVSAVEVEATPAHQGEGEFRSPKRT